MKDGDVHDDSGGWGVAPSVTSLSLLQQVRQHDPEGWRRLVTLYSPLVYGWCRQRGLQSQDAADVLQEVFHAVLKSVARFERDRAGQSFRGWLRTITRNKLNDYWRRSAKRQKAQGGTDAQRRLLEIADDEPGDAEGSVEPGEINLVFRRALELVRCEFDNRTWQAFWETVVDGRSPADVAAELGVTTNVVYIAKSRILSRVRAEFAELLE